MTNEIIHALNALVERTAHEVAKKHTTMYDLDYPHSVWGLQKEAYRIAEEHGFHTGRNKATRLALIHSEVSEALEADRNENHDEYAEELADIVIRVLDTAEIDGVNLLDEIHKKMAENEGREHKHGKRY